MTSVPDTFMEVQLYGSRLDTYFIDRYAASAGVVLSWPPISERIKGILNKHAIQPLQYPTRHEQQRETSHWHCHCEALTDTPLEPKDVVTFDQDTVRKCVDSYKRNIQNIHPLISPRRLDNIVTEVLGSVFPVSNALLDRTGSSIDTHHMPSSQTTTEALKRKRLSEVGSGDGVCVRAEIRFDQLPCRIETALVLMVLALGQICLHRRRCGTDAKETRDNCDILGSDYFRAAAYIIGTLRKARELEHEARKLEREAREFEHAVYIIGTLRKALKLEHEALKLEHEAPKLEHEAPKLEHEAPKLEHEAPKLEHVWAFILGSLYYDQVGQPVESYNWVKKAGERLRQIIAPDLERYMSMKRRNDTAMSEDDNEKCVAAWTCLLFEGDVLTAVKLPAPFPLSGTMLSENKLPYPNSVVCHKQGFEQNTIATFVWRMHMYVVADDIRRNGERDGHRGGDCDDDRDDDRDIILSPEAAAIEAVQSHRPVNYKEPATDVLAALQRVVYWGAELLIYRPYVQSILAADGAVTTSNLTKAQYGVYAIVQRAKAFYHIHEKFVVTNMYGIVHAQFGDVLVLDSVEHNAKLSHSVDKNTVDDLFRKTMNFLRRVAEPSSSLKYDLLILEDLYQLRNQRQ